MKVREHIKTGLGAGLLVTLFWGIVQGIFFFLASWMPDADHPLDFLWRSRKRLKGLNLLNLKYVLSKTAEFDYACSTTDRVRRGDVLLILIFHTWEFLLFLYLLKVLVDALGFNFLSPILLSIFWGTVFHILLDVAYNVKLKIAPRIRTFSLIEYCVRKRLLRKKGIDVEKTFQEMLDSIGIPR